MRVLLVGSDGYLGVGLQCALRERHDVFGWGRQPGIANISAAAIRDGAFDAVVNCAAVIDRRSQLLSPDSETYRVNVEGVRGLVHALSETDVRLVQLSTREVYGPVYGPGDVVEREDRFEPKFLVTEDRTLAPATAYAESKLIAERIAQEHPYCTVIRASTCYTDMDHPRGGWILGLMKTALRGDPITIEGTGKQVRDPLHVDDLARLVELTLEADPHRACGSPFNAGGGEANVWSVRQIVAMIDPHASIEWRSGGDYGFALDNRRAEALIGWRPRILFSERVEDFRRNVRASLDATH